MPLGLLIREEAFFLGCSLAALGRFFVFYIFVFIQSLRAFRRPSSLVRRPVVVVSFGACGLLCLVGRCACRVIFLSARLLFFSFFLLLFLSSSFLLLLSSSGLLSFALLLFSSSSRVLFFSSSSLLLFSSSCLVVVSFPYSSLLLFRCFAEVAILMCFGAFGGPFLASWGLFRALVASFGTLLGLLGPLETLLDASWRHLGRRRREKVRGVNGWNGFGVDFGSCWVGHFGSFLVSFLDIAVWCAL